MKISLIAVLTLVVITRTAASSDITPPTVVLHINEFAYEEAHVEGLMTVQLCNNSLGDMKNVNVRMLGPEVGQINRGVLQVRYIASGQCEYENASFFIQQHLYAENTLLDIRVEFDTNGQHYDQHIYADVLE